MYDTASIIKAQVTPASFLRTVGVEINRAGFCKCPFHGDHDASMKVYKDPNRGYHCFGCHAGGDVINLAMRWYGLPFKDTVKRVADDCGVILPEQHKQTRNDRLLAEVKADMRSLANYVNGIQRREAEWAYWAAFDAWLDNDRTLQAEAPRSPSEAFSDAFCEALRKRDELEYNLRLAEERRKKYGR